LLFREETRSGPLCSAHMLTHFFPGPSQRLGWAAWTSAGAETEALANRYAALTTSSIKARKDGAGGDLPSPKGRPSSQHIAAQRRQDRKPPARLWPGQHRREGQLASLAARACDQREYFRPHQYLAYEADTPQVVYRIEEGWACRFRLLSDGRRQITALFLPGDYCEPQWAFGAGPAQQIMTLTKVRTLNCPVSAGTSSEQRRALLDALVTALERQTAWLVTLGRRTAMERIAHLLCEIYERMDNSGLTYSQQCAMPLTQMDIADIAGLTPVHVNRTLQTMRATGLIELQARWLRIPDLKALRQAASLP